MTRSAPQPPTSPRSGPGSDGEETAATAAVAEPGPAPKTEPDSEPTEAESGAEAGTKLAAAEETAAQGSTTEPEGGAGSETGTNSETGASSESRAETGAGSVSGAASGSQSEAEGDRGAAAAAKSRLPALVRTMTVTAIDRPQQQAGPVGRPGKAVLAGAAVAGALLVSVPFMMLGGNDDKDRRGPASAGTVLGGNAQDAPGEFAATTPDTGSSGDGKKDRDQQGKQKEPVKEASASAPVKGEGRPKDAGKKDLPEKQSGGKQSDGRKDQPAKAGSGVTLSAPVSLRSHLSGRCIDVPGGDFSDGKQLFVWDCNNGPTQKWQFASDGTVRIKGKCLDVANANYNDGTPIQIAWCSGNAAQKFVLNASHDLVNTVVGKCVDIKDNNRGSGARLQLWSCAGTDNQKWSV
ncbi:ricin-type beta-trefoil lectin domain protein [Streptomyces sp. NPDC002668]|uniref:ricin-type beta-trefoil lectin domain protein n=1 Tax=Streptomyces sp. NPDC002668 TaxID=3154422 RepID=UPI00332F545C